MPNTSNDALIETIFGLSRLLRENMSFCTEVTKLSMLQLQALVFLKYHQHAQMREIAEHFKIELPSATSLLNKLCIMKLVQRETDPKDRRIVRITLTKKGEQLLEKAMQERKQKMHMLLSHISNNDRKQLLRILQTIHVQLEKNYKNR